MMNDGKDGLVVSRGVETQKMIMAMPSIKTSSWGEGRASRHKDDFVGRDRLACWFDRPRDLGLIGRRA